MLTSLALIFLVGLSVGAVCRRMRLPRIIGMLITGIVLGPYVLDMLDPSILGISSELRQIALIIILLKAGLSLDISDLKKVGRPAVMMAFVPACFEILGYVIFAPAFFGITRVEAAVMGAVLAAVSPAVVVPRMIKLIEEKCGTAKSIPQLILAGASCDDIFVVVLFSAFAAMAQGGRVDAAVFMDIPLSIVSGLLLGACAGIFLSALLFRAVGVMVCLIGTSLDFRERMFCVIAYLPKATVQAAMGAVPLSMGMPCGKLILSVAVVAILLTAPVGALGIDRSYKRLLKGAEENI